jgi:hypothetical protein
MDYYKGNALYSHIDTNNITTHDFVSGNMWQLVYGDNTCNPKLLVLAIGSTTNDYNGAFSDKEKKAFDLLQLLSKKSGVPLKIVKFNAEAASVENVIVYDDLEQKGRSLSMEELSNMFKSYGLPVSNTQTAKYVNDMTSSAYHNWQRSSLGRELTVSDIDLWKLNDDGSINSIYELKRSFISIEKWNPYPDDYRNFQLISNLANLSSIAFKIAYNVRQTNPFKEDISTIKVFNVDFSKKPPISFQGVYDTNKFFD